MKKNEGKRDGEKLESKQSLVNKATMHPVRVLYAMSQVRG